jgi:hypothetical protein
MTIPPNVSMILNNAFEEIRPCFPFKNWHVLKPVQAINSAYPIGVSRLRRLTFKHSSLSLNPLDSFSTSAYLMVIATCKLIKLLYMKANL